jgi:hypothetical protein
VTAPLTVLGVPLDAETLEDAANVPQAAENSRRDVPGRLWERLPGAGLNSDALTAAQWERIASVRNTLGTRSQRYPQPSVGDPNQRACMFGRYQRAASGIIRAGKLIRGGVPRA